MVYVPPRTQRVGESAPIAAAYALSTVPSFVATTLGFCIDRFPFPGTTGSAWPIDGLLLPELDALDKRARRYGRRICDGTEILLAAAGQSNHRYPYQLGEYSPGLCDPSDESPQAIGSFPKCISETGVRDFGVRGTWALVDEQLRAALPPGSPQPAEPITSHPAPPARWAVIGGLGRSDTFYAPTNFGIHRHFPGGRRYPDDGVRFCADLNARDVDGDALKAGFQSATGFAGWAVLRAEGHAPDSP